MGSASRRAALAPARTCYDHLAGQLGVAVTDAMIRKGHLGDSLTLTAPGLAWLATLLDADAAALARSHRRLSAPCLDWTERRPHLSGAAGALLCRHMFGHEWIERFDTSRGVRVTPTGHQALSTLLGIDV